MWFAWVYYEWPIVRETGMLFGSLRSIANELIENGDEIMRDTDETLGDEETRKKFKMFKTHRIITREMIESYVFDYCGCTTSVRFVADGYSELLEKFNAWAEGEDLSYRLRSDIEETDNNMEEIGRYLCGWGKHDAFDKFFIEVCADNERVKSSYHS